MIEAASYEEVAYLLLNDDLPTPAQLDQFNQQLCAERALPDPVIDILRQAPAAVHPMALLRTATSALVFDDEDAAGQDQAANVRKAMRLVAKIPTLVTAGHRLSQGQEPIAPRADLSQAANFLYMLRGQEPADYEVEPWTSR